MLPSDDLGNAWESAVTGSNTSRGMTYGIFYAYNVKAGITNITCPGTPSCVWAIHEFSGVQTTSDPFDNAGLASTNTTSISVPYIITTRGELMFGMVCSPDQISFGLPTAVTVAQQQQTPTGSIATSWSAAGRPGSGTLTWTTPNASYLAGAYLALL